MIDYRNLILALSGGTNELNQGQGALPQTLQQFQGPTQGLLGNGTWSPMQGRQGMGVMPSPTSAYPNGKILQRPTQQNLTGTQTPTIQPGRQNVAGVRR